MSFLTVAQYAEANDLSTKTVYRRIDNGSLKAEMVDGQYLIAVETRGTVEATLRAALAYERKRNAELMRELRAIRLEMAMFREELERSR